MRIMITELMILSLICLVATGDKGVLRSKIAHPRIVAKFLVVLVAILSGLAC